MLAQRGYLLFLASLSVLALSTIVAFAQIGIESSMYTLGINKNALGATFGCGIVVCLCYLITEKYSVQCLRFLRIALMLCTVGCFFSLSRGAWLATKVAFLTLLLMPLVAVLWQLLPQTTAEYATDISFSAHTFQTRFETMDDVMDAFRSSPLMDIGIGLRKLFEPHNVLILTPGESGIIGLLGFLGMFGSGSYTFYRTFQKTAGDLPNRQLVLIGISILILSLVHGCMDVYWRRSIGFREGAAQKQRERKSGDHAVALAQNGEKCAEKKGNSGPWPSSGLKTREFEALAAPASDPAGKISLENPAPRKMLRPNCALSSACGPRPRKV